MAIHNVCMQPDARLASWTLLNKQREAGQFCDITFKCNGGDVVAHKCVLASVSDFFNVLLISPISTGSSTDSVVFDHFNVSTMKILLDVIYAQVDRVEGHAVVELLKLAEYVQLDWLVNTLVENIREHVNESNVCEWYTVALQCGIPKLKFLCECYVRENREKVCGEEVSACFATDVLEDVQLWNSEMDREVVLMDTDWLSLVGYKSSTFFLDPKCGIVNDQTALIDCFKNSGMVESSFIYQGVCYVAVMVKGRQYRCIDLLWKYQHMNRTMELFYRFERPEIFSRLTVRDSCNLSELYVSQIMYDHQYSLYVIYRIVYGQYGLGGLSKYLLFKFDLKTLVFSIGYVEIDTSSRLAYLDSQKDVCLVTPYFVYELGNCSFKEPGADQLRKIELSKSVENHLTQRDLHGDFQLHKLEWKRWGTANVKGHFYCLVSVIEKGRGFNLILKLSMETRSWRLCAGHKLQYAEARWNQTLFYCDSKLYVHSADVEGESRTVFFLDEQECALKTIHINAGYNYIDHYVVFPYHILL